MSTTARFAPPPELAQRLTRLIATRRRLAARRAAVEAEIAAVRRTISELAKKHREQLAALRLSRKASASWQARLMQGTPEASQRAVSLLLELLTTTETVVAIAARHQISDTRLMSICQRVMRRLSRSEYWPTNSASPAWFDGARAARNAAGQWLAALSRAERLHSDESQQ